MIKTRIRLARVLPMFVLLSGFFICHAPTASANTRPAIEQKVKKLYGWYVNEIYNNREPLKNRSMIRNHSSRRLWKWLNSKAYREYGADYFLSAQDFARDWGTHINISDFKMSSRVATFKMKMGRVKTDETEMGPHTISLRLVKESGAWKIDRVDGS